VTFGRNLRFIGSVQVRNFDKFSVQAPRFHQHRLIETTVAAVRIGQRERHDTLNISRNALREIAGRRQRIGEHRVDRRAVRKKELKSDHEFDTKLLSDRNIRNKSTRPFASHQGFIN
jgi:hypothetical protein